MHTEEDLFDPNAVVETLEAAGTQVLHKRLGSEWSHVDTLVARQEEVDFSMPPMDYHFVGLGLTGSCIGIHAFDALTGDIEYCLHPGAMYFCPSGHAVSVRGDASEVTALQMMISRNVMDEAKAWLSKGDPGKIELLGHNQMANPVLQHLAKRVHRILLHAPDDSAMLVDEIAQEMCLEIVRTLGTEQIVVEAQRPTLSLATQKRVTEVIEATLSEVCTLEMLAAVAECSRYHFSKAFKNTMGLSPYQYVMQRRLILACDMLHDPRNTLADVAYASGFSSQAHMTTVFRHRLGATPGVYRAEVNGI